MPEMRILLTAETVSRLKEAGFRNMNLPLLDKWINERGIENG